MFISKNALRNITRSKGRSVLIGIIIFIIALSMCIGLSIRQAASNAKEDALADLNITATISPDREAAMAKGGAQSDGNFDKSKMFEAMSESLSLKELQTYAKADAVKSFYYTMSASVNGSGSLEAYSTSSTSDSDSSSSNTNSNSNAPSGKGGMSSSDFQITGYSSDESMTSFTDGTCTITKGSVFDTGTSDMVCIISSELATYNNLTVGKTIKVSNPNNAKEVYSLKIVGIYKNSQSSATAMQGNKGGMGRGGFVDPANNIYTSYNTLNTIVSKSTKTNESDDDVEAINGTVNGTYVLGDMEAYEAFQTQVEKLGLTEDYAVSSSDLTQYERSAEPLENLSKFAGYFLIVILVIGAIILVVLNIFSTRERKYEIGVLAAIGMKKGKVAKQFVMEIMIIALAAVIVGGAVGAAVSVPVTNSLLASQIESSQENSRDMKSSFGRDFNGSDQQAPPSDNGSAGSDSSEKVGNPSPASNYISSVSSAVNLTVLLELLIACIFLAMIAASVSVVAIMRYEPLQILANRD